MFHDVRDTLIVHQGQPVCLPVSMFPRHLLIKESILLDKWVNFGFKW